MDFNYIYENIPNFYHAAWVTLKLSGISIFIALILGLIFALILSKNSGILRKLVEIYIEIARNTPLLIQLFFLYYGLPKIGIRWDGFTCGVVALVFLGTAYMAEAIRAGIEALPHGQIEAAKALAMKPSQIFLYVIMPQAWAISLPALVANIIFLIKETSVINAVSVAELMFVTKDLISTDYMTNEALFMLFISYLILLLPLTLLARLAEKRAREATYGI